MRVIGLWANNNPETSQTKIFDDGYDVPVGCDLFGKLCLLKNPHYKMKIILRVAEMPMMIWMQIVCIVIVPEEL